MSSSSSSLQLLNEPFVPAFVVVDMQHDFVYGSLPVPGAASIIGKINALLDLPWNIRVASHDFHPEDHISFAETHGKPLSSRIVIFHPDDHKKEMGVEQTLWPTHCVAHTAGADFVEGLDSTKVDVVVHKGTHSQIESYSGFKDSWKRGTTKLPEILNERGITDVFLVGVAGNICVKCTAIDAVEFGYRTWLITDAIKSTSEYDQGVAFQEMLDRGILLTTYQEVKQLVVPELLR